MRRAAVAFVSVAIGSLAFFAPSAPAEGGYQFVAQWGGSEVTMQSAGIATDTAGNVYLVDKANGRIDKVAPDGRLLTVFAAPEWHPMSQVLWPIAVGVDGGGNLYAADSSNHIRKFSPAGHAVAVWGSAGSGNGQFDHIRGVAADASGNVYVVDGGNLRVQRFDSNGNFILAWATPGASPQSVAVDGGGNVYVVDAITATVDKFSPNGSFLHSFGGPGDGNAEFKTPHGAAVDSAGNIFVADLGHKRIQKLAPDGTYLTSWAGSPYLGFTLPLGVAVSGSSVYEIEAAGGSVSKFDSAGTFVAFWSDFHDPSALRHPQGIAVFGNTVVVADTNDSELQRFAVDGVPTGSVSGAFNVPMGLAFDAGGTLYVADTGNHRIQVLDSQWNPLRTWGSYGSHPGEFEFPLSVAVAPSGDVFVGDDNNQRIEKFDSNGTFKTTWGGLGQAQGQFDVPLGVATDSWGNVYVADEFNHRIQKFDSNGTFLTAWGSFGEGDGQFNQPAGVAIDVADDVYVADMGNGRIQKFGPDGAFKTKWGTRGYDSGQFNWPAAVAVDTAGNVYVADMLNNRVEKFRSEGGAPVPVVHPPAMPIPTPAADLPPFSKIGRVKVVRARALRSIAGTARDDHRVARVEISLLRIARREHCRTLTGKGVFVRQRPRGRLCAARVWLRAHGTSHWVYRLRRRLTAGSYVVYSRATDNAGHTETTFTVKRGNRLAFRLR